MTRRDRVAAGWFLAVAGLAIALASFLAPGRPIGLRWFMVGSVVELVGIIMVSVARRKPEGR